ncbi:DUF4179 domain-containing protein [Brevibacillus sp. NRS-1366]|uniref:DUF4179 domain-containing protein n=1 Tax=Brevibacillus sp. NRS-1366 TaxID=3233899 RepID=UPI003D22084C
MKDRLDQKMDGWLKQQAAHRSENVPVSFHAGFLQMLDSLPDRSEATSFKRPSPYKKRLLAVATVIIIVAGFAAGTFVSPAFADWVNSFFTRPELDKGLQTAAKQGFSQIQQASVTDQGITLKVKEVLTDTKRLIMTYSLETKDGTMLDPTTIFEEVDRGSRTSYYLMDRNNIFITNENGRILSQKTVYQLPSGRRVTQSVRNVLPHDHYADVTFDLEKELLTKQIYLNFFLKKVNGMEGTWSLRVPIDLEKSIAATTTFPIQANYTTPSGLSIQLKEVTYSPTVTTFAIQSNWTDEAEKELEENHPEYFHDYDEKVFNRHWVHYDVLDDSGKVVMTSALPHNKVPTGIVIDDYDLEALSPHAKGSLSMVQQSYIPIDLSKSLTFVLTGISQLEKTDMEWKVDMKNLGKKKETFTYKDYHAAITGVSFGKKSSILELEEEISFIGAGFDFLDAAGNIYPIERMESEWGEMDPKTKKQRLKLKLHVKGLTKETKSITFRLNNVVTFDQNVNWQVAVPSPQQ